MCRRFCQISSLLALFLLVTPASARTMDAGSIWLSGGVGPGLELQADPSELSKALILSGQIEYPFIENWSALGELGVGIGSSHPAEVRIGARYRVTGLSLPVSPYMQGQLILGKLLGFSSNQLTWGGRGLIGLDFFLTKDVALGGQFGFSFIGLINEDSATTTLSKRTGAAEWLLTASVALDGLKG